MSIEFMAISPLGGWPCGTLAAWLCVVVQILGGAAARALIES
jgi:hypothetical protein